MIVWHGGIQGDVSTIRLPADAYPAIFAYSLNRKLRKLYSGEYFQFRQGSSVKEYPTSSIDPNQAAYLVKIYDQKARHGVPVRNAVQLDETKQPVITQGDFIRANFNQQEYLDVEDLAPHVGHDFTITSTGDGGSAPRPMIGIWGPSDRITVEPSDIVTRFTFNNNLGTILDSDGKVTQCISGFDPTQNNSRVLTVKTGSKHGHITMPAQAPAFTSISIGREGQRLYEGDFMEATMHLGQLTPIGSEQLFTTTRTYYGN